MEYISIGSAVGGYVKAPTLAQLVKDGIDFAEVSYVTRVFRPSSSGCWSFLTEHPYRVNVYPKTDLFQALNDSLEDFRDEEKTLAIRVPDQSKPIFDLVIVPDWASTWEVNDWGYTLTLNEKPKTKPKATKKTA